MKSICKLMTRSGDVLKVWIELSDGRRFYLRTEEIILLSKNIRTQWRQILSQSTFTKRLFILSKLAKTLFRKILNMTPACTDKDIVNLRKRAWKRVGSYSWKKIGLSLNGEEAIFDREKVRMEDFFGIVDMINNNQYDLTKFNVKGTIFIDAGAHIGEVSIHAALLGAKKIYAFEPMDHTYELLKQNISSLFLKELIVPVKKALGDRASVAIIHYGDEFDCAATIDLPDPSKKNSQKIEITTIDDFVKECSLERVDFIKMDVEGYEKNILLGAQNTINKFKPILSFSAYHKPEDKEVLPRTVKLIRGDYKIKLMKYDEEDFYCY